MTPVHLEGDLRRAFQSSLMLWYTGMARIASQVAKTYTSQLKSKESVMKATGQMVETGQRRLLEGDLEAFGSLLDEAWELKSKPVRLGLERKHRRRFIEPPNARALGAESFSAPAAAASC